jgi:hypothetical protein
MLRPMAHSSCRETEAGWDKDLAEDVKSECEDKYGHVVAIKVETDSEVSRTLSTTTFG